jgi:hypothetical protein
MSKKAATATVFLDLKKAFDTVDHEILTGKLKSFGLANREILWFQNYLSDRKQCVKTNDLTSSPQNINTGVPQGSILGPLLFTLYINDIETCVENSNLHLYADDTVIYASGTDPNEISCILTADLLKIENWLCRNKLTLNIDKTKWMLFSTKPLQSRFSSIKITISKKPFEKVDNFKYLGIKLDEQLCWNDHIDYLIKKVKTKVYLLRRLRPFICTKAATQAYHALIQSSLTYCDVVWASCSTKAANKLQRLQNQSAKIVLSLQNRSPSANALQNLNLLSLDKLRKLHLGTFTCKAINEELPDYLNKLIKTTEPNPYATRYSETTKLTQPRTSNRVGEKSFSYQAPKLWNSLPHLLQCFSDNPSHFKPIYQNHLKCND